MKQDMAIKRARIEENIATVLLWGASGLTLFILVAITGYIVFRGFYFSKESEELVIEQSEPFYYDFDTNQKWMIVINKKIRTENIKVYDLQHLLMGKPKDWSNFSKQDIKVIPYVLKGMKGDFGKKTVFTDNAEEIISSAAKDPRVLGVIPYAENRELPKNVKTIKVKQTSVIVPGGVMEITNGRKLRRLDKSELDRIMTGKISNWNKLGGPDLEIKVMSSADFWSGSYQILEIPEGGILLGPYSQVKESDFKIVKYNLVKKGLNLDWHFIVEHPRKAGKVGGIFDIIMNTLFMVILTVAVAGPIGVGAAIYLTEYSKQGRMMFLLRLGTETLAGIPSIIFGLFGFLVFVQFLGFGIGLISGTLTLTLMILPTIVRTSEEAIKSVPVSVKEGSLALGASKWQTIIKVVIPAAAPGILTGMILGVGRAIGETAALLFTMGFDYNMARNLHSSARVLSVHLYQLVQEGLSLERAFSTATILIIVILAINLLATRMVESFFIKGKLKE